MALTVLRDAGELGLIDTGIATAAADAYLAMRRRLHEAGLNDEETVMVAPGDGLAAERAAVERLWAALFGAA